MYDKVMESVKYIRSLTDAVPSVCVILGSGLGGFADVIEDKTIVPYINIPHFPQSSVEGHAGNLIIGRAGGKTVAAMQGRFHYYEGYSMRELTYPVYVMKFLGVENLVITNACGAVNEDFAPGELMIIDDFINFSGLNPLTGPNDERFGPRFPDMTEAYSKGLREAAERAAGRLGISCQHGVYAFQPGPCYETAAEIRAYKALGADVVGMSTVPETITGSYLGLKVLGISCITNMATGIAAEKHTHEAVLKTADEAGGKLCALMKEIIALM